MNTRGYHWEFLIILILLSGILSRLGGDPPLGFLLDMLLMGFWFAVAGLLSIIRVASSNRPLFEMSPAVTALFLVALASPFLVALFFHIARFVRFVRNRRQAQRAIRPLIRDSQTKEGSL